MSEDEERDTESEEERQYSTVNETADTLRVSTNKLRQWIKSGLLKADRPGGKFGHLRISVRSIKKFLDRHTTGKRGDDDEPG